MLKHLTFIILSLFMGCYALPSAAFTPALGRSDSNHCASHIYQHERLKNIPTHLLAAISKVESGRYNSKTNQVIAWPWTINVNGQGHYFASKSEAVRYVKNLLAKGTDSIDVGCMQVNLKHHPDAFSSIEAAFDPRTNIEYAAKFLTNLKNNLGSWNKAVAHYHSANAAHHIPYRKKVMEIWQKERQARGTLSPLSDEQPYGQYLTSFTPNGRAYRPLPLAERRPNFQNDPNRRLNEARYQLAQYRERAAKTLEHYEGKKKSSLSKAVPTKQNTKSKPAAYQQAQPNPYRFAQKSRRMS